MYSIDPRQLADPGTKELLVGPWKCEKCGNVSQFATVRASMNKVFCRTPSCDFQRLIDKKRMRVIENDGTHWEYDNHGRKKRVTGQ